MTHTIIDASTGAEYGCEYRPDRHGATIMIGDAMIILDVAAGRLRIGETDQYGEISEPFAIDLDLGS